MIGAVLFVVFVVFLLLAIILIIMNVSLYFKEGIGIYGRLLLMIRMNNTLKAIIEPHFIIKAVDLELWEKTDFGDYEVRFELIEPKSRTKDRLTLIVNKHGQIVHMVKWRKELLEGYLRPGIKLENIIINK